MDFTKLIMEQRLARWNRIVTEHMRLVGETASHFLFIHATKGHRRVSKKRLGMG